MEIDIQQVLNYPQSFRTMSENTVDYILQHAAGKLDLDVILYSSINTLPIFEKVLNAVKLTDNLINSEYYRWFIETDQSKQYLIFESYAYWITHLVDDHPDKIREMRFICENILYELSQFREVGSHQEVESHQEVGSYQEKIDLFKKKYDHILS